MGLRKITQEELDEIIERHRHYLREDCKGWEEMRADLSYTDLSGLTFGFAYLPAAFFNGAKIYDAIFYHAHLSRSFFQYADIRHTVFDCACLNEANFWNATIDRCSFVYASMNCTRFSGTKNAPYIPMACPETGSFIGFKKAFCESVIKPIPQMVPLAGTKDNMLCAYGIEPVIVTLEIPSDAKRSSAASRKCRCDKAKVLDIRSIGNSETIKEARSIRDASFVYRVGEMVSVDDFDEDRWNECSTGIHFFINRQEAVDY